MRVSFQSWGNRNGRLSMTALRVSVVHDRFSFSIQKLGGGEISRISLLCSGFLGFELLANHFSYDVIRVDSHFFFFKHTAFNCDPRIVNFLFSHVFICFSLSLSLFHFKLQTGSWRIQNRKFADHVEVILIPFYRLAVVCSPLTSFKMITFASIIIL